MEKVKKWLYGLAVARFFGGVVLAVGVVGGILLIQNIKSKKTLEPVISIIDYVQSQEHSIDNESKMPHIIVHRVRAELLRRKKSGRLDSYEKLKQCVINQEKNLRKHGIKEGDVINLDQICLQDE